MSEEKSQSTETNEQLIRRVEEAARQGAREGAKERTGRGNGIGLFSLLKLVLLTGVILFVVWKVQQISNFEKKVSEAFTFETNAENHDLLLENNGFMGYTAADFADAILGDSSQLKKLEVYQIRISDVATLVNTGLANLKAFSKSQYITYHGTATYTVDLGKVNKASVSLDEGTKTITLTIPHAELEPINIKEDEIEFGQVEKGLLAPGTVKATPEDMAKVQNEARDKMNQKLLDDNIAEEADRFAKMSVWEIYQPLISDVDAEYILSVEFQ